MAYKWTCTFVLLGVLFGLGIEASSRHMNDIIKALKELEDEYPRMQPVHLLGTLRHAAGLDDPFTQLYLGKPKSLSPDFPAVSKYLTSAFHYNISDNNQETGVVLTTDGTTVALRPLLLGLEAGFLHEVNWDVPTSSNPVTKKSPRREDIGPDGWWDNNSDPQTFTLSEKPSLLTMAQVYGAMDGALLAQEALKSPSVKLSALLTAYYNHRLDQRGLDVAPRMISQRRRDNFKELVETSESNLGVLKMEAVNVVEMSRRAKGKGEMNLSKKRQLMVEVTDRVKASIDTYAACPHIVSRYTWGAASYIGYPTYLYLPVSYLFIHHTYSPSTPCYSFEQCSADMRSMQRYHQNTNGWSDIGYNFVVGADGYVYEGRGWDWVGAHCYGYNSVGYGVSFIGDFSYNLPTSSSMSLVRDKLAPCAKSNGDVSSGYTLWGHRQGDNTACPGNKLFAEIQKWPHFRW